MTYRLTIAALLLALGLTAPVQAQNLATELFISEYVEGSSNNKAIEIYNGTGAKVDLSTYSLEFYFNGNSTATNVIALTGVLANDDVHVVSENNANATILAIADQTNNGSFYNGNDAIVLKNGSTTIDVIGQVGNNPGTEWGSGDASTQNNTIRRKSTVCSGDTDSSDAFDTTEYDGFPQDTFDGLGSARNICLPQPVIAYDASNLELVNLDRVATWPDASGNGLDAVTAGGGVVKNAFRPRYRTDAGTQPAVFFNGTKMGLIIPNGDVLTNMQHDQKGFAVVLRTGDDVTTRQVLYEIGDENIGMNAYVEGGELYVGAWDVTAGAPAPWNNTTPVFLNTTVATQTDYVLIVSLRRDTAAQPARFEAYLNGTAIGLDRNVDVLGKVNESGGLGRVRGSTRFADGSTATNPAFVFFRGFIFEFSHYTGSLVSYKAEELTNQLTAEYGIAPITDAPVLASATTAPTTPVLGAAYPNPFVQQALVPLTLVEAADVTLAVYDALGRQVALLADGAHEAGAHTFALDAASLASGVYFVRALVAPASGVSEVLTQRISVVK